jgi:hypothetical protein
MINRLLEVDALLLALSQVPCKRAYPDAARHQEERRGFGNTWRYAAGPTRRSPRAQYQWGKKDECFLQGVHLDPPPRQLSSVLSLNREKYRQTLGQ